MMAHQLNIPDVDVAQAAATLEAGALRAAEPIEMSEAAKLSDYAMEVFWRIYEAMRVGVEIETVPADASPVEG
jgi:hypothetical protein